MRRVLLMLLLTGLALAPVRAFSVAVVQSAANGCGSCGNVTVTMSSTPTNGNLLVACYAYYSALTPVPPSGWTAIGSATSNAGLALHMYRKVASSEGTTYQFHQQFSGSDFSDNNAAVIYELSGQDSTTPINQNGKTNGGTSISTLATSSLTPSVMSTFGLACVAANKGTALAQSVSSVSSGWTLGTGYTPPYNLVKAATKDALTSDTTTAISATFTTATTDSLATGFVLVAPSGGGGGSTVPPAFLINQPIGRGGGPPTLWRF